MTAQTLRHWAYRLSTLLAVAYIGYVLVIKVMARPAGGPIGDVGEFLLVLASVCAFSVGLFADENLRKRLSPPAHTEEDTR